MQKFQQFSDWIKEIQVQELKPLEVLFSEVIERYKSYTPEKNQNIEILKKAYEFGKNIHKNQKRDTGVLYFTHPLIVASLLQYYKADENLLVATMLHDAIEDSEEEGTSDEVLKLFGEEIFYLIDGVSKVNKVNTVNKANNRELEDKKTRHEETLQKIFSHSAHDSRILTIKIADRIHNISTIGFKVGEEKRQKKIAETLEVFVASCEKLQLDHFKDLLLNACSYFLFPEKFLKIEQEIENKSAEAKKIFEKISEEIQKINSFTEIVYRRYHVAHLLHRGDADTYDLRPSDLFYVDIVTDSKEECYQALSWLGKKYNHKTRLLSDLIANSPENGYQALKTSMIVESAYLVRFHILSHTMKESNEKGIFTQIEKRKLTLPFFSENSTENSTHNFVGILKNDMLSKKKCVHNPQKGQKYIPVHAKALDAIIHFFPEKFVYVTDIIRNGERLWFNDEILDNDILECEFSDKIQADVKWMSSIFSNFGKVQLQNFLKKKEDFEKYSIGKKILQSAFDIFKEGEISLLLQRYPEIFTSFFAQTREELYVFVAEGMVSSKEVLLKYEEIKNKKKTWRGKIRDFFSHIFSGEVQGYENIDTSMKVTLSSKMLSSSQLIQLLSQKSLENEVLAEKIEVKKHHISTKSSVSTLVTTLSSPKRESLFTLFSLLKSDINISNISFVPSRKFYAKILGIFTLPLILNIFILLFFFPYLSSGGNFYSALLPLFFVFIVNTWGYSKLSHYFVLLRKNNFFISTLFALNAGFITLYLTLFFQKTFVMNSFSLFFVVALVIISLIPSLLLFVNAQQKTKPNQQQKISLSDWEKKKKEKIKGYIIRFLAVIIWGIQPLYIKYTPMNTVDIDYRMFFMAIGGVLVSSLFLFIFLILRKKEYWKPRLTINSLFWAMVISELVFVFLMNKSLLLTSSTNMIVFNNFAPLFALLIAIVLWRKQIRYLKDKSHLLAILGIFFLGGIGGTLIFYNDILYGSLGSIKGDVFAILLMATDVVLVVSQIRYAKYLKNHQSIFLNLYAYGLIGIIMIPVVIAHFSVLSTLSFEQILYAMGAGVLSGTGQILNYEAFRRMDGFIAFLMFNFSILITFTIEAFILGEIIVTPLLIIGGLFIIISSALAEYINTKCEKKELDISS